MALPTTGPISLQNIKTEFGPAGGGVPINLSSYYKGAEGDKNALVRFTTTNANIPRSGQIKLSDFRGGVKYIGSVSITIVGEADTVYDDSNNGYVQVTVTGNSPSYTIGCTGRTPSNAVSGQLVTFSSFDSSNQVTITITDTAGTASYGPYTIGLGTSYGVNLPL